MSSKLSWCAFASDSFRSWRGANPNTPQQALQCLPVSAWPDFAQKAQLDIKTIARNSPGPSNARFLAEVLEICQRRHRGGFPTSELGRITSAVAAPPRLGSAHRAWP